MGGLQRPHRQIRCKLISDTEAVISQLLHAISLKAYAEQERDRSLTHGTICTDTLE